jgi:uncharacterized protein YkwD
MRSLVPRTGVVRGCLALAGVVGLLAAALASGQGLPAAQLGQPPRLAAAPRVLAAPIGPSPQGFGPVDTATRQAVVDFYNLVYRTALAVPNDWNGSVSGCNAGSTSAAYANATLDMVNYFRAMAGLPASVPHEAVKDGKAQQAALMMTANNSLSHSPPVSWTCYTADGAEAAGKSNLALGAAGATAIALYMNDNGIDSAGHRRWVLYPPQVEMGTGSTGNANDLWVLGPFGSRPASPETVPWPPAGYVPYQTVYAMWSFAVNSSVSVSFSGATVAMTQGGAPVPVTLLTIANGYGDNTIVWRPTGLSFGGGSADQAISVQVNGVLVGGVAKNYAYTVTVIDPARVPPLTFTDNPLLARTTPVRAVHVVELRRAIDSLRARYGLAPYTWTNATLTSGATVVQAAHVGELRAALATVYAAVKLTPPTYSTPTLTAGATPVSATEIAELRAAVLARW